MTTVEIQLKTWGNSVGAIIPKEILEHENLRVGDTIKIDIVPSIRKDGFGMFKQLKKFTRERDEHEDLFR